MTSVSVYVGRPVPKGGGETPQFETDLGEEEEKNKVSVLTTDLKAAQQVELEKDLSVYREGVLFGKIHEVPAITKGVRAWTQPATQIALATFSTNLLFYGLPLTSGKARGINLQQEGAHKTRAKLVWNKLVTWMNKKTSKQRKLMWLLLAATVMAIFMARDRSYQKFFRCKYQWLSPDGTTVLFATKSAVSPTGVVVTHTETQTDYRISFSSNRNGSQQSCLVVREKDHVPIFGMDNDTIKSAEWQLSEVSNAKKSVFIPIVVSGTGKFKVPLTDTSDAPVTPEMEQLYIFARLLFEFRDKMTVTAARRSLSTFSHDLTAMALSVVFALALTLDTRRLINNPKEYIQELASAAVGGGVNYEEEEEAGIEKGVKSLLRGREQYFGEHAKAPEYESEEEEEEETEPPPYVL